MTRVTVEETLGRNTRPQGMERGAFISNRPSWRPFQTAAVGSAASPGERAMKQCGCWAVLLVMLLAADDADGEDVFLTIGGGYNPSGNQVSLEKNVQLFQRMLEETYPGDARQVLFFADGDAQERDVQFVDPNFAIPRANELLAEVFGQVDEIDFQYRNHELSGVDGPTTRDNIEQWFKETGSQLSSEDRLFLYVTAHGGRSPDKEHPHDTVLLLWNRQPLRVRDLAAWLRYVPAEVPVAMIMVQCFSGGFAYSVYEDGTAESGLADANRCGFFATVHDRVAAGCTPDIDEANYHEYSTSFFEALRGKTRFDEPIERPDYDGDGRTSLAEAHAYVVLTSTTIDIPVCTSDEYLRAILEPDAAQPGEQTERRRGRRNRVQRASSETPKEGAGDETAPAEPAAERQETSPPEADSDPLLSADSDYRALLDLATPAQRAVLEGLSQQLGLSGVQRASEVRAKAGEFEQERKRIEEERNGVQREFDQIREQIKQRVLARWPELSNRWHPLTNAVLTTEADDLVSLVEAHPEFARFGELRAKLETLEAAKLDYERKWVKCRRLERALESVALAGNLPLAATAEQIAGYERLAAAEGAFFGPQGEATLASPE